MTPWTIYWLTRLDTLHGSAVAFFVFSCISALVTAFIWAMVLGECPNAEEETVNRTGRKVLRWVILVGAVAGLLAALIPTTKEMAAIIVVPKVLNNEDVQAMGSDLPKLAREWLESLKLKNKE